MAEYDRLVSRLPTLYQPEQADDTLLNRLLLSTGAVLDQASVQATHVLFSHWFDVADKATWDAHYQTARVERGLRMPNVRDVKDQREILSYPYISDLGRLCALLGISPWREPALLRETVEEYRQRVTDLLDAYRLGLTTLPALRRLIEAELPEDMGGALSAQRWPFAIEEPRALHRQQLAVEVPESPFAAISPLWRWQAPTDADAEATPTVYLQGIEAGDQAAQTDHPQIECVNMNAYPVATGLAYQGTLAAGQTLRLSPARRSWLVRDGRWWASPLVSTVTQNTDPSANGAWQEVAGLPAGQITQVCETSDRCVWLIVQDAGKTLLYRYDGTGFLAVDHGQPASGLTALCDWHGHLWVGTNHGLYRIDLYPQDGELHAFEAVATIAFAVHHIQVLPDQQLAVATAKGLWLQASLTSEAIVWLADCAVYTALAQDDVIWLGVDAGLLRTDASFSHFVLFDGVSTSEDQSDWRALEAADIATAQGGLPAVKLLAITPDRSIWVGSPAGLARYYARSQDRGQAYQTVLEAFPDVCSAVHTLQVDERGMLWIGAAEGLLRFDGRDLAQHDFDAALWLPLGQADTLYPDETTTDTRSHWRYSRDNSRWERYQPRQRRFTAETLPQRSVMGSAIQSVLITDSVLAELGSYDGSHFEVSGSVDHSLLRVRIKPTQDRIVAGGLPALPRPENGCWWRYLQQEAAVLDIPAQKPWWTTEGRLFPPPQARPPWPGHFRNAASPFAQDAHSFKPDLSNEAAVFIYPPSAVVWMNWPSLPRIGVQVRLFKRGGQLIDPAITDRVWAGLQRAKAAGVPVALLVEGEVIQGV